MKKQIEKFLGGVAMGMTMPGPRPVFSPPDDAGAGGGGDNGGEDNGDTGGQGADAGAQSGDNAGDAAKSKLEGKGLFSKRTIADTGKAGDDDGANQGDGQGEKAKVPEKFLNKDGTPNVDAWAKSHADLERQIGELKRAKGPGGGEVPETAEGYFKDGVAVPDTAPNFTGLTADDPGLKAWADVCKKRGVGKDLATSLMSDMLVMMNDHAAPPIDPDREMQSLGKGGPAMVDGLFVWVEGMERSGDLSESDIGIIENIMTTADGARFLAKMRNMTGVEPIPVMAGSGTRGMSAEQWHNEMKAAVKAKDYKRQEELEAMGEVINGTAPGISGRGGGINI